jgi:glyoxylase I family protein
MERVSGIGGLFFRARDPESLGRWYDEHLGISLAPTSYDAEPWQQAAGPTVFAPFEQQTTYFGSAEKQWMVNFRVRDLDAMAAQLRAAGISIEIDPQQYPNGRFGRLYDPEGNAVELWEPRGRGQPTASA